MIKVAITDDHLLFREGIRFLLEQMDDIAVAFEASNGSELIQKLEQEQPDIVLLDLQMDGMDGVETLRRIRPQYPDLGIIILTVYNDLKMMAYLMELGANTYLLKDTEPETLHKAIESVYREGYYFTRNVDLARANSPKLNLNVKPALKHDVALSPREIEVLKLICQEEIPKGKAQAAGLDHDEAEKHRKLLHQKLVALTEHGGEAG